MVVRRFGWLAPRSPSCSTIFEDLVCQAVVATDGLHSAAYICDPLPRGTRTCCAPADCPRGVVGGLSSLGAGSGPGRKRGSNGGRGCRSVHEGFLRVSCCEMLSGGTLSGRPAVNGGKRLDPDLRRGWCLPLRLVMRKLWRTREGRIFAEFDNLSQYPAVEFLIDHGGGVRVVTPVPDIFQSAEHEALDIRRVVAAVLAFDAVVNPVSE